MTCIPAVAANLYYLAETHAIHKSFHVLGVLAFLAAYIAALYYFKNTRQEAILALFLTEINNIFAASYNFSEKHLSPTL